jgi:hypothetical protein
MTGRDAAPTAPASFLSAAAVIRHSRTGEQLKLVSWHGGDSALVETLGGVARYALLSELEGELPAEVQARFKAETAAEPTPEAEAEGGVQPEPRAEAEAPDAPSPAGRPPAGAKRFDRWTDDAGYPWIYDQPRRADGTYKADNPETEAIESALGWYPCKGDEPVQAGDRPGPAILEAAPGEVEQ